MPKNLVYQTKKKGKNVAGKAKRTKLLRTNLQDGGTCDWVPEDETTLIPKVITQDGVYKASDEPGDIYGYSEVTVQGIGTTVMGDLGTITIYKNGTYYANTAYLPSQLGQTGDGATDSKNKVGPFYGYKTVIVNVTSSSSGSSDDSSGSNASNSVVGKNKDGNMVKVSIDENGVFMETPIAISIEVTTKPRFLVYKTGDTLNFNGIKVTASAGPLPYTSDKYPNGIIGESDLTFPVKRATGGGGSKMTVPVKWKRPEDNKELSTSFEITVNDP